MKKIALQQDKGQKKNSVLIRFFFWEIILQNIKHRWWTEKSIF